jgi:hypothetical protein
MEQYPCAAMNYPTSPEVVEADYEEKFDTMRSYIAENIMKIEE